MIVLAEGLNELNVQLVPMALTLVEGVPELVEVYPDSLPAEASIRCTYLKVEEAIFTREVAAQTVAGPNSALVGEPAWKITSSWEYDISGIHMATLTVGGSSGSRHIASVGPGTGSFTVVSYLLHTDTGLAWWLYNLNSGYYDGWTPTPPGESSNWILDLLAGRLKGYWIVPGVSPMYPTGFEYDMVSAVVLAGATGGYGSIAGEWALRWRLPL